MQQKPLTNDKVTNTTPSIVPPADLRGIALVLESPDRSHISDSMELTGRSVSASSDSETTISKPTVSLLDLPVPSVIAKRSAPWGTANQLRDCHFELGLKCLTGDGEIPFILVRAKEVPLNIYLLSEAYFDGWTVI